MSKEKDKQAGWRGIIRGNVLMMGLVSFFTDVSSEMIYPLLPIFFTGLVPAGVAAVYLGIMEGVGESTASLLKIFAGRLSDALRKRKLFAIIGYGISALCRPGMALAGAGWQVVALRFGDRVGKGIRTSPRDALISDSVDADVRGLAFSFHRALDHAGAVLGPLLAILILYALLGYDLWRGSTEAATPAEMRALRWLFAAALLPGLAALAVLAIKVREIRPVQDLPKNEQAGEPSTKTPHLPGKFYFFLSAVTVFTLGNSSDLFLLFYAKTKFQLGLFQVIGLWVALHISKIIFSLPGGWLSDKFGRRLMIVSGWLVYVGVYLGMTVVAKLETFWLLILIYGIYYGLTEGAEKALVADYVPSSRRGRAYGLYHGAVGLAALPASLMFGVFWAVIGPKLAFAIGAGLAGLATVLLAVLLSTGQPVPKQA